ncbi:NAD(P)-dependent dehydrogenase (short-subunit alcohol dehydrogenase family) [Sphingomonas sp. UYAg733]
MRNLSELRIAITGASEGLGFAMAGAFLARGSKVTAIARNAERLERIRRLGANTIAGDATDAALMDHIVAAVQPDILVLNAGARVPMLPIDRLTWDGFSDTWNTDVKASFVGVQAALNIPIKPGSRVMIMSSGSATVMSSPLIEPESLRLSGGHIGAKRMVWYMAHQANAVSRERGLDIHFQVLIPGQLMPGTAHGHAVASVHAEREGISVEQHVIDRYGSIMEPDTFGEMVANLAGNPIYIDGVAYGFRVDAGIMPMDVEIARK